MNEYRKKVDRLKADYNLVRKQVREERVRVKSLQKKVRNTEKAQLIIQTVAKTVQETVHDHIAKIVSRCLDTVFDEPYRFNILFERKRGRTEARFEFERGKLKLDPKTGVGGGVIDVAAFALRLACLLLRKPQRRKLLVLDEPFRMLSRIKDFRERMRGLLEVLSEEMGIQIVLVTHQDEFRAGKVVEL